MKDAKNKYKATNVALIPASVPLCTDAQHRTTSTHNGRNRTTDWANRRIQMSIWQLELPNVAWFKNSYSVLEFFLETAKTISSHMHGIQKNLFCGV